MEHTGSFANLPARNNTNFPLAVTKALEATQKDSFLLKHQVYPLSYFEGNRQARGILIASETGSGKSITASAIAEDERTSGRRIIIIAPKTLQNNFKGNITKYKIARGADAEEAAKSVTKDYSFVSANANNMIAQLKRVSQPAELQNALDNAADDEDEIPIERPITGPGSNRRTSAIDPIAEINLEGATVIFDEAHHLFNGVISGSINARRMYDLVMRAIDIRIIFLSSNVMTNSPFELVPCFNMLAGFDLLPIVYQDFMDAFVNKKTGMAKATEHFKSRIFGLVSYFGSWFETGGLTSIHKPISRAGLPTRLAIREVFVPMSPGQYAAYASARDKEIKPKSFKTQKVVALSKPNSGGASYRIRSRQLSNFWLPTADSKTAKPDEPPADGPITLPEDIIENLDSYSPKFATILSNIHKHDGAHGMIFSSFLHTYGLKWFAQVLEYDGFVEYQADAPDTGVIGRARTFAFITGDMDVDARSAILDAFNSPANRDGSVIQLLLGSPAMAEGVDTKRIRHVHIMESIWHFAGIDQIIARAVRYGSHDDLPEAERTVQPYIYLSDYPESYKSMKEPTTDVSLYFKSMKKKVLIDSFFRLLVEGSIDCTMHMRDASEVAKKQIHCMLCVPDGRPMFTKSVNEHLAEPISCRHAAEQTVEVSEIKLGGRTFYWRRDAGGLYIYELDRRTGGYIRLAPSSPWYAKVFVKLT